MTDSDARYDQVNNIIRRSQALILNIKLLGADTTEAKELLTTAKNALEKKDFETAIEFAKKSMVEVMELKKQIKSGAKKPAASKKKKGKAAEVEAEVEEAAEAEKEEAKPGETPETTPEPEETQPPEPEAQISAAKLAELESPDNYEVGFSYLIEENRADYCFKVFSKLLESNENGLCICRINPTIIRRKYNFSEDITMLWLTDRESSKEATISPSLESMIYVAEEFIDKNEKALILLDGIEYLISNNGFNPVLRFIRRLIDKISETDTILLIGVGSRAMNEQELKLLERELNPVIFN